jgi:diguanylate cyclase (GGDEF)-like protein
VKVLSEKLRESDLLGRWGGEEFLILAPNTGLDDASVFAARIRRAVAKTDFSLPDPVTISIGVAQWKAGDTLKSIVVRADQAMYQAKENGRNCVSLETAAG